MIFEQERHLKSKFLAWNPTRVRSQIEKILNSCVENYENEGVLCPHPNDPEYDDIPLQTIFHFGSSGTLWGLHHLHKKYQVSVPFSFSKAVEEIRQGFIESPPSDKRFPSFFFGESSIDLLDYKIFNDKKLLLKLEKLIKDNESNKCFDLCWGVPGTTLVCLHLYRFTGDVIWSNLFRRGVNILLDSLEEKYFDEKKAYIWWYDRDGHRAPYFGAGHGFFGNIIPILSGKDLLEEEIVKGLLQNVKHNLTTFAVQKNQLVNWPTLFSSKKDEKILMQWCHGAPGVIHGLRNFPADDPEVEGLLIRGAEAIWQAGPLSKGAGLCHGTDGNGMALLKIYNRTKDQMWLERARTFAMDAIEQAEGFLGLWVGNMGLAIYLDACLNEEAYYPGIDSFL